jgi:putative hemolysin
MRAFLTAIVGGLVLAGCTPTAAPAPEAAPQSFPREMSVADRAACTGSGGRVERRGRMGAELCVMPFADAGKACTDKADCQGKCVSTGSDRRPVPGRRPLVRLLLRDQGRQGREHHLRRLSGS